MILSAPILKGWSESPRTLAESLAWSAVETGETTTGEGFVVREFKWKGATREPFLTLERMGWVKMEAVTRLTAGNVTVHFWEAPEGVRGQLKVKTD